ILTEIPRSAFTHEARRSLKIRAVGVPGEVEKELGGALGVFDVADIDDPEGACSLLVRAHHLRPGECGRKRVDPDIGQWRAEIRKMVIHPEPTRADALGGGGEAPDVSEVVVRPDDDYILRHRQSRE